MLSSIVAKVDQGNNLSRPESAGQVANGDSGDRVIRGHRRLAPAVFDGAEPD
jgi:hypothetical protein